MQGLTKAIKLEFNNMMERKFSLAFYLFSPVLVIAAFYVSATLNVDWGAYAALGIKLYDLFASDIISIVILFVTTQIMVLRIVGERAPYGTLDRELIAISRAGMFFGKLIANFLFVFLQCALIYVGAFVLFPARNYGNQLTVFLFIVLIGLLGLILGLAISIFSKNKEQAVQLVPFLVLILMLMGGIIVPLNQMPSHIVIVAGNSPLTLGVTSLKNLTLDGVGFEDVTVRMILLLAWIVGIGAVSLLKFNFEKKSLA